jgi:cellulose synthase/poly-beta-1,6-N-acetylglucosamine synthase-like glycosyltransferase
MTNSLALALFVVSALLVGMQIVFALIFLRRLNRNQVVPTQQEEALIDARLEDGASSVAVILCLRGADPSLADCLAGLAKQNWPPFYLVVVVDSMEDPAVKIVEGYQQQFRHLITRKIASPISTCSLKCSAILTGIDNLPPAIEIIALLDADTVPDPNWLRDLVRPLCKSSRIAVSTGSRWFEPELPSFGSTVRQIWNTAAIVQMGVYNIPWGGSLAIRRSAIQAAKLTDRFSHAFCEDTLLTDELSAFGLQVERVPDLITVNRETSPLGASLNWIARQLLTIRLHNRTWPLIQAHAFATFCCNLAVVMSALLLITRQYLLASALISIWLVYQLTNAWLLSRIEGAVIKTLRRRRTTAVPSADWATMQRNRPFRILVVAMLLTQWIYPWACCIASFARRVSWRGVEYLISQDRSVQLIAYQPYVPSSQQPNAANHESIS